METPRKIYNSLNAEKIIKEMTKRKFEAYYADTKQKALQKAIELIPEQSVVSWGGTATAYEIDLITELRKGNYKLLERDTAPTPEERARITQEAHFADFYIMSANAISLDGKLINIDGYGDRMSALVNGPKNILVIAGINKVENDEQTAIIRARNEAAPINAIRLKRNTPCTKTGECHDCTSEDCICAQILVTRLSAIKNRIKVILVGEELGF